MSAQIMPRQRERVQNLQIVCTDTGALGRFLDGEHVLKYSKGGGPVCSLLLADHSEESGACLHFKVSSSDARAQGLRRLMLPQPSHR